MVESLFGQSLGKNLGSAAAFLGDLRRQIFALGSRDLFQLCDIHPRLLGEGMRRGRRLTIFISDADRRPSDLLDHVGLGCSDTRCHDRQPPRSIEMGYFPNRQSFSAQQGCDAFAQFLRSRVDHSRWNLFATNL